MISDDLAEQERSSVVEVVPSVASDLDVTMAGAVF